MTDTAATRPYGVLGRVLGHSYTPTIYKELAGLEYVRFEREPEDLQAFMTSDEWEGTNVTIPYKRAVMEYLDELSPLAERMGNVNTITRLPDGRLRGDNTDYFGFRCLVEELGVEVAGKTGTAEEDKSRPNHGLFVGYAPYDNPEVSMAIRIANGYSSDYACQLSKQLMTVYFDLDENGALTDSQTALSLETVVGGGD